MLSDTGKRRVLQTMVKFVSNVEVQVLCCRVLGILATTGKAGRGRREGGRGGGKEGGEEGKGGRVGNGGKNYIKSKTCHLAGRIGRGGKIVRMSEWNAFVSGMLQSCGRITVHLFCVAHQNDILFTKEFIYPICLSMRVRSGCSDVGPYSHFNFSPMLVPKTSRGQPAHLSCQYH